MTWTLWRESSELWPAPGRRGSHLGLRRVCVRPPAFADLRHGAPFGRLSEYHLSGTHLPVMICPVCRSSNCFRSHRTGVLDYAMTALALRPWRCYTCEKRFFGTRAALPFWHYAHCPRCGNFDLERIAPERVSWGTLVSLKRWLGFPAYRCDPCRLKFFSVMHTRRILSSTLPVQGPAIDLVYMPVQAKRGDT